MLAIPVGDISQFEFDSGMAFVRFGDPVRKVDVGFPHGGPYSQAVCARIKATVDAAKQKQDPYAL